MKTKNKIIAAILALASVGKIVFDRKHKSAKTKLTRISADAEKTEKTEKTDSLEDLEEDDTSRGEVEKVEEYYEYVDKKSTKVKDDLQEHERVDEVSLTEKYIIEDEVLGINTIEKEDLADSQSVNLKDEKSSVEKLDNTSSVQKFGLDKVESNPKRIELGEEETKKDKGKDVQSLSTETELVNSIGANSVAISDSRQNSEQSNVDDGIKWKKVLKSFVILVLFLLFGLLLFLHLRERSDDEILNDFDFSLPEIYWQAMDKCTSLQIRKSYTSFFTLDMARKREVVRMIVTQDLGKNYYELELVEVKFRRELKVKNLQDILDAKRKMQLAAMNFDLQTALTEAKHDIESDEAKEVDILGKVEAHKNLAILEMISNDLSGAKKTLDNALKMLPAQKKVIGEKNVDHSIGKKRLEILEKLAVCHFVINGLETYTDFLQQHFEDFEKILGKKDAKLAFLISEFGDKFARQNLFAKAIIEFKKALYILEENSVQLTKINFSKVEKNTLWMKIAVCNIKLGKRDEAIVAYQKAKLLIENKKSVEDYEKLGAIYCNIGVLHQELLRYDQALENLKKSFQYFQKPELKNHILIATVLRNMGVSYRGLKEYEKAISSFKKAKELLASKSDKNADAISQINLSIAKVYTKAGEYKSAIDFLEKTLKENNSDSSHPYYPKYLNMIALNYKDIGNFKKAHELLIKVLNYNIVKFGAMHANVAVDYNNMGSILMDLGEEKKAVKSFTKALEILHEVGDKNNSNYKIAYKNLEKIAPKIAEKYK